MDIRTKRYRKQQFENLKTVYSEYKPKIKIIKPNGETKWITIEESELLSIIRILLGGG